MGIQVHRQRSLIDSKIGQTDRYEIGQKWPKMINRTVSYIIRTSPATPLYFYISRLISHRPRTIQILAQFPLQQQSPARFSPCVIHLTNMLYLSYTVIYPIFLIVCALPYPLYQHPNYIAFPIPPVYLTFFTMLSVYFLNFCILFEYPP